MFKYKPFFDLLQIFFMAVSMFPKQKQPLPDRATVVNVPYP